MNNPKDEILKALKKVTGEDVALERPKNETFGDYSTNIALVLAKERGKSPLDVANELAHALQKEKIGGVEKIEAVGGFINFWLSENYLASISNAKLEPKRILRGKKILVEFTDPNPFKIFHVGHLYSNIV